MKLGAGRGQVVALAFALVILAGFALFHTTSFSLSTDPVALVSPWLVRELAAIACLSTVAMAIVSFGLVRHERARRRQAQLRLSQLLEGAEQADQPVTLVDRKGRIEYVNRAVELMTGYGREELIAGRAGRWFPWHADDRARDEVRARLLAGASFRDTVNCRRKDGTRFLLQEHVEPLREGKGAPARFLSTAWDITRQKEIEERLYQLANFDPLTGLPNRAHFTELLQQALAQRAGHAQVAVLILDIDRFRYINDVLTPEAGDEVLGRMSKLLMAAVKAGGVVGRLGSDEFGVIHRGEADPAATAALAASIQRALSQSATIRGHDIAATASVGIALAPADGDDAATLMKNAAIALSITKSLGRSSVRFFRQEMSAQIVEQYAIQRSVAGALRKGEYQVHYQPYCDLSTGRVSGAEALIRWDSEDLGRVSPIKFIPALEDSGLMLTVGEWVLRTACRQIHDWHGGRRPVPVAVNLSQIQFSHRDLVGLVSDVVLESEIDPRFLTLELTESICIHDIDFAADLLTRLKHIGVSISVDDFGTGYSSLSYVKKLPVDNLKIDMSFVRDVTKDPDTASIISAITSMARGLGLKTIAEGIETSEQANILHLLRCDMGQGYHFGRAVPAVAFEQLGETSAS